MNLTRTQWVLLKLALKALPVVTTMGGALFGYLEGHDMGHNIMAAIQGLEVEPSVYGLPWYVVLENTVIGTVLGLAGGIMLSCFGLIFLDFMTVVDDPASRYTRKTDNSVSSATGNKTYYKKYDVEDHERSTQKVAAKYDDMRQKEEEEIQEILEIGTKGIREKKLGKKVTTTKRAVEDKDAGATPETADQQADRKEV